MENLFIVLYVILIWKSFFYAFTEVMLVKGILITRFICNRVIFGVLPSFSSLLAIKVFEIDKKKVFSKGH